MKYMPSIALAVALPLTTACQGPTPAEALAAEVAAAYGVERFDEVSLLEYTFHVQLGERNIERRWRWEPRIDRVTSLDPEGERSYLRAELDGLAADDELLAIDARFINDQYWLLFPLHLVWDTDLSLSMGEDAAPISGEVRRRLTAQYGDQGGYTPGDAYDLYLGPDGRVEEWVFRKGGAAVPSRITAWEHTTHLPPLTLELDFPGPAGDFRVWFSDLRIEAESTHTSVD